MRTLIELLKGTPLILLSPWRPLVWYIMEDLGIFGFRASQIRFPVYSLRVQGSDILEVSAFNLLKTAKQSCEDKGRLSSQASQNPGDPNSPKALYSMGPKAFIYEFSALGKGERADVS